MENHRRNNGCQINNNENQRKWDEAASFMHNKLSRIIVPSGGVAELSEAELGSYLLELFTVDWIVQLLEYSFYFWKENFDLKTFMVHNTRNATLGPHIAEGWNIGG